MQKGLIGVFDSGVGGLTVAKQIEQRLPGAPFVFFGDTKYVPYGARPAEQVVQLIAAICHHLVSMQVEVIVMACNTSSALAYEPVCSWCPVPVLGIINEAAKAAVHQTRHGKIGVIANKLTASSGAYERAVAKVIADEQRLLDSVEVFPMGCPKLVPLVESGRVNTPEAREALLEYLVPLQQQNIDTLVLGCTHYPFLAATIRDILGPDVALIDPAIYVADTLRQMGWEAQVGQASPQRYQVSGQPDSFARTAQILLNKPVSNVEQIDLGITLA